MVAAWHAAHRDLERGERLPTHLRDVDMAGWNTVSAAHAIALLYEDDPARAIALAAGSGGDTDTIASMVGAMLGAAHGTAVLPTRLIVDLDHRETVIGAAERMLIIALESLDISSPYVTSE